MFVLQGYKLLDNVNFRPTLLGVWVSDQRSYSFTVDLYWNNLPLYFGFNFKTLKKKKLVLMKIAPYYLGAVSHSMFGYLNVEFAKQNKR